MLLQLRSAQTKRLGRNQRATDSIECSSFQNSIQASSGAQQFGCAQFPMTTDRSQISFILPPPFGRTELYPCDTTIQLANFHPGHRSLHMVHQSESWTLSQTVAILLRSETLRSSQPACMHRQSQRQNQSHPS
jgi:hypothetical protein